MSARFISVDRDTPMLLPPDLREWVPEDDLVHFVIEAVDRLPLGKFRVNDRGTGDRQFPPHTIRVLKSRISPLPRPVSRETGGPRI